jgi:DNA-3-methyladenine glycosylase
MDIDFTADALEVAHALLGVCLINRGRAGVIVETEAYRDVGDPACHTFFRKSARDFVATHPPGTLYIYLNYGVHWMLNFLTFHPKHGAGFVLIRALQPCEGEDAMYAARGVKKPTSLCSGPGKLTQALAIDHSFHSLDFKVLQPKRMFYPQRVHTGPRIGISRACDFPWRFTVANAAQWLSRPQPVDDI